MGHIFISYSHKDTEYAHKLAEILKRGGFEPWIDARLDYGSQWPQEIQKQLDSCSAFIILMTPRAFDSEWVQSELNRAKRKNKPIFPLLLEGDEPWLSVESTQFFDVRDKSLPTDEFYRDLWHVIQPANPGQTLRAFPPNLQAQNKVKKLTNSNLMLILAGIAGLICICLAVGSFLYLKQNSWAIPSPSQTQVMLSSPTVPVPTEKSQPNLRITIPPIVVNELTKVKVVRPVVVTTAAPKPVKPFTPTATFTALPKVPMALIPAGEFKMGSNDGAPDEKPVHLVYLNAFYIDKYEVSNFNYKACVDARVCAPPPNTSSYTRASYYGNPDYYNYPVIYATWEMAKKYCEWRGARLPTEPEWEKAARGTQAYTYPWGNTFRGNYLNYCDKKCPFEHADSNFDDGYTDTAPVDAYPQGVSPYGVFNMSGNVFEWTADWYNVYPGGDPAASDQFGQNARVRRSGSWLDGQFHIRPTLRIGHGGMTNWLDLTGIRCAQDAK
jgi:formylglycine-generating enzyme required for sulfatase activity